MTDELWRASPAELRKRVGLTQLEVAIALGKQPSTISDWERGRRKPEVNLSEVKKMMRVYEVDLDTLIAVFDRVDPNEV